jgi:hypothetical protein
MYIVGYINVYHMSGIYEVPAPDEIFNLEDMRNKNRRFIKELSIRSRLIMISIELWSSKLRKFSMNSMITCMSGRN